MPGRRWSIFYSPFTGVLGPPGVTPPRPFGSPGRVPPGPYQKISLDAEGHSEQSLIDQYESASKARTRSEIWASDKPILP